MNSGLLLDDCFKEHLTGAGHAESPDRLDAVRKSLDQAGLSARMTPVPVTEVADTDVLRIHDAGYLERIARTCEAGAPYIDTPDSAICRRSYQIARLAAGSVLNAVEGVMKGRWKNAFCAVRPPGHHAERDRSMGFCLLNNVAIAAEYLIQRHGLKKVMILDWDVHHGNGTQHSFEDRSDVLYISLHGHPAYVYPGTGHENETGVGPGDGFTLNLPMMPGSGDDAYRKGFDEKILGVPVADPRFDGIQDLEDLQKHWLVEIENFFNTYKMLENKETYVKGWRGVKKAREVLARYTTEQPSSTSPPKR